MVYEINIPEWDGFGRWDETETDDSPSIIAEKEIELRDDEHVALQRAIKVHIREKESGKVHTFLVYGEANIEYTAYAENTNENPF